MENAERTGNKAGRGWELSLGACAVALMAWAACPALHAQDAGKQAQEAVAGQARDQAVRLEVQASTLPRLDAHASSFKTPRVDLSLFPSTSPNLGAVVGMSGFSPRQAQALGLQPVRPSVDLGVRYSHRLQSHQVDITAWRRMRADDELPVAAQMRQPVYGARVEMNLAPSRAPVTISGGFIGVQLEGGANIAVKRNNGHPMLYYRSSF
jgi:hypothetical protein